MKKLLKNKKGFTLMEMLIVVAIIVILVAISIPTFSGSLDSAKEATDDANFRAAEAAAISAAMLGETGDIAVGMYYDIDDGVFEKDKPKEAYGGAGEAKGKYIKVKTLSGSTVELEWAD